MPPLSRRVLVVEDDYLQALDIGRFVSGTGASVLGPATTLEKGLRLAPQADAAVLDIDLGDHQVFPLADLLLDRGVPFIFYSGATGETPMPQRFWHVPLIRKPVQTLTDAAIVTLTAFPADREPDIEVLLPKLRLAARLIYGEQAVADRLVERLLVDAIQHVQAGHDLGPRDCRADWLLRRMRLILKESGSSLMN
ncbi:hypothetical protein ACFSDD_09680 [Salipiger marinus]|uniref:hypothetical protein n=1 Tax=Salipiger marinus TaxID=555512 RepID=UPI001E5B33FF|nr:hypothetical protein [Salipiger manganoxidans]MCD1620095.1 hypothetical protein [Salipiger manganoxidans]MEB3420439.1 hypothetical protein [Salipiger manganoxidans]